jgi:tetratricopeptide (TPR) repeat protein
MTTRKKISVTGVKTTPGAATAARPTVSGVEPPTAAALQLKVYEQALQLFSQRKWFEARDGFLETMKGPANHISDKARSYVQVCERRSAGVEMKTLTAEDHFNYGVERLNARDFEQAKGHFGSALLLQPNADHILYTMALCCGLAGDGDGACENLKRAIDVEPRNRILARQDPEFLGITSQLPGLRALLQF